MLSANDSAKKSACYCAANCATQDLGNTCPVICNITGIGFAVANASCVGLGCHGAGRQDCDKGGG
jgi:hypothetical protein